MGDRTCVPFTRGRTAGLLTGIPPQVEARPLQHAYVSQCRE